MSAIMECFLDSVTVPSFKVKALDYLLLSQKIHKANQLRESERATIYARVMSVYKIKFLFIFFPIHHIKSLDGVSPNL